MKFTGKLLITLLICFWMIHLPYFIKPASTQELVESKIIDVSENILVDSALVFDITLKRIYLDGEVSEEYVCETVTNINDFWNKYRDWQVVSYDNQRIILEQQVDDISPLLKVNGYFGVTENGILSIFNGTPDEKDIIQSFFQIDIEKLEGKKLRELKQGIRVHSKEVYQEVLETMRQYSIP